MSRRANLLRKSLGTFVLGPEATVMEQRKSMTRASKLPMPKGMSSTATTLGGVPGLRLEPKGHKADGHLLFLHGGGYCIGSATTHKAFAARLAKGAGMSATALDYRLAPEHPFPAGLDDCIAAYEALVDEFPAASIAIAGDSAGGGAVLATLLRIRDRGFSMPSAAVMFSPWIDLTGTSDSMRERVSRDPMLAPRHLELFGDTYLNGTAANGTTTATKDHIEVSPLFAELHDLAPMLVMVGTDEVLYDDSTRLVDRVTAAGGQATLDVADGMWHVYAALAPLLPEGSAAITRASRFIIRHSTALSA
jgi:epsilon-lactone hydrolase